MIKRFEVPGWPNVDGYYYCSGGAGALQHIYNQNEVFSNKPQPVGDITEYEVNYVSTWFRTHQNPVSMPLHLTDFFVQNVSQDNDQLWYDGAVVGNTNGLGNLSEPGPNGPNAMFVSDVLGASGNTVRTDYSHDLVPKITRKSGAENSNEQLNYSMDYLHFGNMNTSNQPSGFDNVGSDWTHINNFNRGNTNYNPEENNEKSFREIKFVSSSGTENFACRPSMGTTRNWIDRWVLVRLDWKETMADGKEHDRYGYYLAFDFATESGSTKVDYDGFYSNWIIKITPAYFTPGTTYSRRVMCEDLGGSFDFDFNDIVFDVAYDSRTQENIIAIQAAGGTLPIYVGEKNDKLEAHRLLGQVNSEGVLLNPTNVIPGGTKHEIAIYRVKNDQVGQNVTENIYKMPIYVVQDGTTYNANSIDNKQDYEWSKDNPDSHAGHYTPSSDKVPRMFAVPVGVKWSIELSGIDEAYRRFCDWVKDDKFYYKNPNGNGDLFWYNRPDNDRLIYEYHSQHDPTIDGASPTIKQWLAINVISIANQFANENYATEIITISKYDGANSIIDELTGKSTGNSGKEQTTFAYILKAKNGKTPKGRMVPVWVEQDGSGNWKAYHYGDNVTGGKVEVSTTMLNNLTFVEGTWQPNFTLNSKTSSKPSETQIAAGEDALGYKTYICKFSFEARNLYYLNNSSDEKVWCDYIMFFEEEDVTSPTSESTNYKGSDGEFSNPMKSQGDVIWYETYCIM